MSPFDDLEIYRSILESLPTGLCILDLQKNVVLWSDGAERITGRRRHEVIGHSCVGEPLVHCDQQDCEWCHEDCPLAQAMKTSQPIEAMSFIHHKKGHEIPVHVFSVPVRNARGLILGAVEIFEDQKAILPDPRKAGMHAAGCVDELTGLASRVLMYAHLREALATFQEMQVPFAVLCFRVQGLEKFRASFGPDAASSLLQVIGQTLEGALWKTDIVGRWSEDEFLVILNGCREQVLPPVKERFRRMLASDGIEWWGERRSLPIAIGHAACLLGDSIESLIERLKKSAETFSAAQVRSGESGRAGGS